MHAIMKKTFFIQFVQTGACVPLLALLCLLPCANAGAQGYTTSTYHFFPYTDACDSTIVRNWKDTAVFTCSHHPSHVQYSHSFHMRISTVRPAKVIGLPAVRMCMGKS